MSQHHRISVSQEPQTHLGSSLQGVWFSFYPSEDAFSFIKNNKYELEEVLFLIKDREEKGCKLERMQINQEEKS